MWANLCGRSRDMKNREIRLKARPTGLPRESDFEIVESKLG